MKNNTWKFGLLILIFTFTTFNFGQNKTISQTEYDIIRNAALEKTGQNIRRVTTTETRYLDKSEPTKVTIVQEFLPPDKSKWLVTENKGDSVKKTEIIYVGDLEYRRINTDDWKTRNLKSGSGSGRSAGFAAEVEEIKETHTIENQKVKGIVYKLLVKKSEYPKMQSIIVSKTWINNDGLIFKTESNSTFTNKNMIFESVTIYDYKAKNIKIEAPIK